ncbi:4-hydroxyphenylacetate 3-monooxygenase oxygenase component [Mycobacteroides abscessus subsp. abscessus]|nr:4-hydroxyphenylacetate 3-monooxygenase oxygenase component [Mycobacteroides abscessus subsp. abscessus]
MIPRLEYGLTYRMFMIQGYPRIKEIIEQDVASGLIYLPSSAADFKSPEVRPYLDKYVRGSARNSVGAMNSTSATTRATTRTSRPNCCSRRRTAAG